MSKSICFLGYANERRVVQSPRVVSAQGYVCPLRRNGGVDGGVICMYCSD